MKNKISIALTTYNGQKYLNDLLSSLQNQTLLADEIIVVDDNSTDNTYTILNSFKDYLPLKIYRNNITRGVNKNFEKAISLCTGDFILICDQDDIWLNFKIEYLYNEIIRYNNSNPVLIRSNAFLNYDSSEKVAILFNKQDQQASINKTFFKPRAQGAGMILNKSLTNLVLPFPDNIHAYDFYISLTASLLGTSKFIHTPLMFYRIHENNAVGIAAKTSIYNRLKKVRNYNFDVHVPGAFRTLYEVREKFYEKIKQEDLITINHILNLNSNDYSLTNNLFYLFAFKLSTCGSRIIIALKLILKHIQYNR